MSEADATVQGPVAPVLDSLTGERHDIHVASPVSNLLNFNSNSIPIDAQVNPKLKPKIWANEFIEFGSLLKRGISEPSYHIAVRSGSVSQSNPTLSLEPTTKSRPISNVETWTTAFQIFVGIYTSKFSLEAPLEMPWGSTHWELWIRAHNFGNSKPKTPQGKPPRFASLGIPKGFCHKFHKGVEYHSCKYKHTCYKFNLSHPANRCNFRSPPATSPQGTPARSRASNPSDN